MPPPPPAAAAAAPRLRLFRSLWGVVVQQELEGANANVPVVLPSSVVTGGAASKVIPSTLDHKLFPTRRAFFDHLKEHAFAGVEASLTDLGDSVEQRRAHARAIRDAGLDLIVGVYSSWQDYEPPHRRDHHAPPERQLRRLEKQLREAIDLGPVHINAHSGSDAWAEENEALPFFERALALQERLLPSSSSSSSASALRVSHETHRGRPLGHPFVALRLMQRLPELRLTADVSHWFLACERLFFFGSGGVNKDKEEDDGGIEGRLLRLAAERTDHVHARVGGAQTPQVDDPTDRKRSGAEIRAHGAFWRAVQRVHAGQGRPSLTMTPEYGPHPYCHDPQTVVDTLILRAAKALAKEFGAGGGGGGGN